MNREFTQKENDGRNRSFPLHKRKKDYKREAKGQGYGSGSGQSTSTINKVTPEK